MCSRGYRSFPGRQNLDIVFGQRSQDESCGSKRPRYFYKSSDALAFQPSNITASESLKSQYCVRCQVSAVWAHPCEPEVSQVPIASRLILHMIFEKVQQSQLAELQWSTDRLDRVRAKPNLCRHHVTKSMV